MKKFVLVLILAFSIFIFKGCAWNDYYEIPCDPGVVTFSSTILPLMTQYCSNPAFGDCHQGGSVNGDFSAFAGVKAKVNNNTFQDRVMNSRTMPPDFSNGPSRVSKCDLQKLQLWLDAGAPNN